MFPNKLNYVDDCTEWDKYIKIFQLVFIISLVILTHTYIRIIQQ